MILSDSLKGTFKDQELSTADSWEQFASSTTMPTSAKLRLVLLVITTQSFNCTKYIPKFHNFYLLGQKAK